MMSEIGSAPSPLLAIPWYARKWAWGGGCLIVLGAGFILGVATLVANRPIAVPVPVAEAKGADDLKMLLDVFEARIAGLKKRLTPPVDPAAACEDPSGRSGVALADPREQAPSPAATADKEGESGKALTIAQLRERLNHATVLVLSDRGSGSGFFITPELVVTNAHVVEKQNPDTLRIASRWLDGVVPVALVGMTQRSVVGDPDYALLRVRSRVMVQPLALALKVEELDPVVSAGFPGVYLDVWSETGGKGIPPLFLRRGEIVYLQENRQGVSVLSHSAEIFPGNSGGPLVDTCGDVVGVNTFGLALPADEHTANSPVKIDFALSSASLVAFLNKMNVQPEIRSSACTAQERL